MGSVILSVSVILLWFFLYVMWDDCSRFVTVEYEIESKKITEECTFALLSDLHSKSFGSRNEKLIRKIEELSPDGILAAGDMLTAHRGEKYQTAADLLGKLHEKYPVYYGMGNHESRMALYPDDYNHVYETYMETLAQLGVEPLVNESVELPAANINICGLELNECHYRKFRAYPMPDAYLPDMLGEAKRDKFQILIAHNPDYFEQYAKWGADLVVSGHVHGGLMRLPVIGGVVSPKMTFFPKYDGGRFEKDGSVMILSRGLGTHTLPIRIFNPGELVVIRLKPGK